MQVDGRKWNYTRTAASKRPRVQAHTPQHLRVSGTKRVTTKFVVRYKRVRVSELVGVGHNKTFKT